jgi:hypothetical protein
VLDLFDGDLVEANESFGDDEATPCALLVAPCHPVALSKRVTLDRCFGGSGRMKSMAVLVAWRSVR